MIFVLQVLAILGPTQCGVRSNFFGASLIRFLRQNIFSGILRHQIQYGAFQILNLVHTNTWTFLAILFVLLYLRLHYPIQISCISIKLQWNLPERPSRKRPVKLGTLTEGSEIPRFRRMGRTPCFSIFFHIFPCFVFSFCLFHFHIW